MVFTSKAVSPQGKGEESWDAVSRVEVRLIDMRIKLIRARTSFDEQLKWTGEGFDTDPWHHHVILRHTLDMLQRDKFDCHGNKMIKKKSVWIWKPGLWFWLWHQFKDGLLLQMNDRFSKKSVPVPNKSHACDTRTLVIKVHNQEASLSQNLKSTYISEPWLSFKSIAD